MKRLFSCFAIAMFSVVPVNAQSEAPLAVGQGGNAESTASEAADVGIQLRTTTEKRAWLREQLSKTITDPRQLRQFQTEIDRLNHRQVAAMTKLVLAQQLPAQQQAQPDLARLDLQRALVARELLQRELWARRGGVGYAPVITWLPQGTSLGASAVISPDGRNVRINPSPFFSSIGPVYTYNLNTGETRLMPPQTNYPSHWNQSNGYPARSSSFGQMPAQHLPPPAPSAYPGRVWHDGMRTRVGR